MDKTAESAAELSASEKRTLVERIHITIPRFSRVIEKIAYCHEHSKIAAEPECLLVKGLQGAGKTTICKDYERRYPQTTTREGRTVPVLATFVPSITTKKSLPTKLLYALGDGAAERGTAVTQTLRLIKLIEECGVELIILDEFQHFIDSDSNIVLNNVSNWLKDLINETRKPVVLVGMPYSEIVLQANPQLERRFAMRESLEPFGWDSPAQQHEFKMFLKHLDGSLPLPKRSNLSDQETAFRMFCASDGFIGYVMKLVRRATIIAIDRGAECLDLELLAEAYDERLASRARGRPNPFKADISELKMKSVAQVDFVSRRTNRRLKAKAARPSAADVLSRKG